MVEVLVGEGAGAGTADLVVADLVDDGACKSLPGGEGGGPDVGLGLGRGCDGEGYEGGEEGGEG